MYIGRPQHNGVPVVRPLKPRGTVLLYNNILVVQYCYNVVGVSGASNLGNRLKATDKKHPGQKPPGKKPPDNKPPKIIEEIIAKYVVDANLFQLVSTNPYKKFPAPG